MRWGIGSGLEWVAWVHTTHSNSDSHDLSPSYLKLPELPENNTTSTKARVWGSGSFGNGSAETAGWGCNLPVSGSSGFSRPFECRDSHAAK